MNKENQQPNKANTNEETPEDSSRSPGVVDRGLSSSENTSQNNTEESSKDSETK